MPKGKTLAWERAGEISAQGQFIFKVTALTEYSTFPQGKFMFCKVNIYLILQGSEAVTNLLDIP